jgi:hypothetical protein
MKSDNERWSSVTSAAQGLISDRERLNPCWVATLIQGQSVSCGRPGQANNLVPLLTNISYFFFLALDRDD